MIFIQQGLQEWGPRSWHAARATLHLSGILIRKTDFQPCVTSNPFIACRTSGCTLSLDPRWMIVSSLVVFAVIALCCQCVWRGHIRFWCSGVQSYGSSGNFPNLFIRIQRWRERRQTEQAKFHLRALLKTTNFRGTVHSVAINDQEYRIRSASNKALEKSDKTSVVRFSSVAN